MMNPDGSFNNDEEEDEFDDSPEGLEEISKRIKETLKQVFAGDLVTSSIECECGFKWRTPINLKYSNPVYICPKCKKDNSIIDEEN